VCVVVFLKMVEVINPMEQTSRKEADGCSGSEEFLVFMETGIHITCSKEPIIGLYRQQRNSGSKPSRSSQTWLIFPLQPSSHASFRMKYFSYFSSTLCRTIVLPISHVAVLMTLTEFCEKYLVTKLIIVKFSPFCCFGYSVGLVSHFLNPTSA